MNILRVSVNRFRSKVNFLQEELDKTRDLLERAERKLDKMHMDTPEEEGEYKKTQKELENDNKSMVNNCPPDVWRR